MSSEKTLTLDAVIEWRPGTQPLFSGIRPSFSVADDLIASEVFHDVADEVLERGRQYEVRIVLPYGQQYREHIVPGMTFTLQAGARVLGSGSVLRVAD